ncbi:hypothetical protein EI77_00418 [Prosthecobacter fusiformis]|uniref:Uncharacterized protein n=1 Tax=Prosthecobacter fusiformis TaxID=48464 RepID=A0A4R7SRM5_9BACT|nr:hypothetical protein EI77_00418 [Prosthecobacter fusiformis]
MLGYSNVRCEAPSKHGGLSGMHMKPGELKWGNWDDSTFIPMWGRIVIIS